MELPEPVNYDPRAYRMVSDSQGTRLEPTGQPVVWVKKNTDAYRTVTDHETIRLEPSGSSLPRILGSLFFAGLASMLLLTSLNLYIEPDDPDDENREGCEPNQVEVKIGNNPLYCTSETWVNTIDSIEVSEDQHLRITGEDWAEVYRWEDIEESIVYGYLYGDQYQCVRYIPEFNLPEDWVVEDLETSFEYPEWCGSKDENQDTRVFEEGAHPYDDVWMYEAHDVAGMSVFLYTHKQTEGADSHREYIAMSAVETWGPISEGDVVLDNLLCFTLPLGLILLLGVDQRRRVFVMNRKTKTVIRKRSGRIPTLFSKTWANVDFSAMAIVRSVRQTQGTTQANEDAPRRVRASDPNGLNIVLKYGDEHVVLVFFEDGGDESIHGQTIRDFLAAMNLDLSYDSIEPLPSNGTFERPTLQYLADYNGVSEWNDLTAQHIIAWYYESDPHFIEKYPEFNENPEFMLEDGGDNPLKEMYWRPLFAEAGLTTVASDEDAQRLLDYLMALLGREPTSDPQEPTENDTEDAGAASTGTFWSTIDAENS
jgi:hypothetical protein